MPVLLAGCQVELPGANTLTHQELTDITAKSNDVVAGFPADLVAEVVDQLSPDFR